MGVTLSKEQAYRIASSLVISDIVSYCKTHPKEYEDELRNQYQKGNISLQQFEKELAIIKTYYEEVKQCIK